MLRKVWKWVIIPLLLIAVGVVIVIYTVNNPTDSLVARSLTYSNVFRALREHLGLMLVSMFGAIVVGVLAGILLSRPKLYYIGRSVENVINVGQTIPSLAILALFFTALGLGFRVAVFALFLYSILPILRNTFAGITSVDSSIIESARGMGLNPLRVLTRIELPIAYPIITAGIRTAVVINVGAATLATFIGGGGFGDLIVTGLSVRRDMIIFTGAALAALTAIILDYVVGQVEEHLVRW
ncbi:MAG: ABC transporter permease [Firmicutes bacterium ML8_F2]|jgi:osmoprotectant transport system permease protein|nr:MAG: ABC transporter permease [Firmicutes bacterium ML8_F2]